MFPRHQFARMIETLAALGLAPEMGENPDRARVARRPRGGANLAVTKRIAVADDHPTTSHRRNTVVANDYRLSVQQLQVTRNTFSVTGW
jgi:hypothetical protein